MCTAKKRSLERSTLFQKFSKLFFGTHVFPDTRLGRKIMGETAELEETGYDTIDILKGYYCWTQDFFIFFIYLEKI